VNTCKKRKWKPSQGVSQENGSEDGTRICKPLREDER